MFALTLLAATQLALPEALADRFRAAIWHDLAVNAMGGNGNWSAALWYDAGSADPATPNLHIKDLGCRSVGERYRCGFTLHRDGGMVKVMGEAAPDRLLCTAILVPSPDDAGQWSVRHSPPRRRGHSQTSMRCKRAPAAR